MALFCGFLFRGSKLLLEGLDSVVPVLECEVDGKAGVALLPRAPRIFSPLLVLYVYDLGLRAQLHLL